MASTAIAQSSISATACFLHMTYASRQCSVIRPRRRGERAGDANLHSLFVDPSIFHESWYVALVMRLVFLCCTAQNKLQPRDGYRNRGVSR